MCSTVFSQYICITKSVEEGTRLYFYFCFVLQRESPDFLARERHRHVPGHLHLPRVQRPHGVRGHPPAPQEATETEGAGECIYPTSRAHAFPKN